MQGTEPVKIHYFGEGVYNETTQATKDIFNRPGYFPQRRDQILGRLVKRGYNVKIKRYTGEDLIALDRIMVGPNVISITDNPLIAELLTRVDVFDWIDWYSEMARKEFGRNSGRVNVIRNAEAVTLQKAQTIIAQGRFVADYIRAQRRNVAEVVPNGVDTYLFNPSNSQRVLEAPVELVFVGKLTKWYSDIWAFVNTVEKMKGRVHLHIYGAGPVGDEIQMSQQLYTTLHGPIPYEEVPNAMRKHDIAVFPVDDDSPCVIPEYFACGLPVIGLKGIYGRLSALIDKDVGAICNEKNIASTIRMLLYQENYRVLSSNCAHRGKEMSWEIMTSKFEKVIQSISES